jgi:hypothetical protein
MADATDVATREAAEAALGASRALTAIATDAATYGAAREATADATEDVTEATIDATDDTTRVATDDTTRADVLSTAGDVDAATFDAVADATRAATVDATRAVAEATRAATSSAVAAAEAAGGETEVATSDATFVATREATIAAVATATRVATADVTRAGTDVDPYRRDLDAAAMVAADVAHGMGKAASFLLRCSQWWGRFRNGGNQWSAWCAYLSFFRHVAKLDLPAYPKWDHYETLALHSGPRFMHARFCIVSDRPEILHVEQRAGVGRLHTLDGPACRWRDGFELHYIKGVRVKPTVTAGQFTYRDIDEEPNAEVRRVMVDRYDELHGRGAYLRDSGAEVLHEDKDMLGQPRRLLRKSMGDDEPIVVVEVKNSTPEPDGSIKTYYLRVHPELRPLPVPGVRETLGDPQPMTCANGVASTFGRYGEEYTPAVES